MIRQQRHRHLTWTARRSPTGTSRSSTRTLAASMGMGTAAKG